MPYAVTSSVRPCVCQLVSSTGPFVLSLWNWVYWLFYKKKKLSMKRECCEQQHSDVQNVRQKEISVKLCLECFHVILSKICDFSCKICSVKTVLTVVSEKFWPYFIHPPHGLDRIWRSRYSRRFIEWLIASWESALWKSYCTYEHNWFLYTLLMLFYVFTFFVCFGWSWLPETCTNCCWAFVSSVKIAAVRKGRAFRVRIKIKFHLA